MTSTKTQLKQTLSKNAERFSSRKGRLLNLEEGVQWRWQVGGIVTAYSNLGGVAKTRPWTLLGYSAQDWERAQWKGGAPITPRMIGDWLRRVDPKQFTDQS